MKKVIFCIVILSLFSGTALAANKTRKAKRKAEVVEDWYAYRFITQDRYRMPQTSQCSKKDYSPAEAAEKMEQHGLQYKITELITREEKPVVVDIQRIDVRNIGYDYTSSGFPQSYRTSTQVITERFVRGEKYCNESREKDLSGELDRQMLNRYR